MTDPVDFFKKLRQMEAEHGAPKAPRPMTFAETPAERLQRAGLGLPGRTVAALLQGTFLDSKALDATRAFMESDDNYLLLAGPTGRGKTMSCGWVLAQHAGYCITGPSLIRLHQRAPYDKSAADKLDNLHAARVVVLDELARDDEVQKGEKTAVFEIINARQERGKRTLITTNRKPLELYQRYDNVVFNRLRAQGSLVLLEGEPDYRALDIQARDEATKE